MSSDEGRLLVSSWENMCSKSHAKILTTRSVVNSVSAAFKQTNKNSGDREVILSEVYTTRRTTMNYYSQFQLTLGGDGVTLDLFAKPASTI